MSVSTFIPCVFQVLCFSRSVSPLPVLQLRSDAVRWDTGIQVYLCSAHAHTHAHTHTHTHTHTVKLKYHMSSIFTLIFLFMVNVQFKVSNPPGCHSHEGDCGCKLGHPPCVFLITQCRTGNETLLCRCLQCKASIRFFRILRDVETF